MITKKIALLTGLTLSLSSFAASTDDFDKRFEELKSKAIKKERVAVVKSISEEVNRSSFNHNYTLREYVNKNIQKINHYFSETEEERGEVEEFSFWERGLTSQYIKLTRTVQIETDDYLCLGTLETLAEYNEDDISLEDRRIYRSTNVECVNSIAEERKFIKDRDIKDFMNSKK